MNDLAKTNAARVTVGDRFPLPVTFVLTHAPTSMGWGGAVKSGAELASIVADLFCPTVLICSDANNGGLPVTEIEAQAASRAEVRLFRSHVGSKQGFGLGAIPVLLKAIRRSRSVYVSGISTWPTTLACLVSIVSRKPYIVSLHGGLLATHMQEIRDRRPLKRLFYDLLTLPTLRAATLIRASSSFEAREAAYELPNAYIVTVPNTFPIEMIPYTPQPPTSRGIKLIYVGRLEEDKGIRAMLQAWCAISGPEDQFTIVGSGTGPYADEVRTLAARDDRVTIAGELPRDQVLAAMADAHALVLPSGLEGSLRENFGNVVVEALAVGRPAIVTRGLAWDHLPAENVGWTFDPTPRGAADGLSTVLKSHLIKDPSLAQRCRTFAEDHFSSLAVRRSVSDMIHRSLEAHGNN